MGSPDTYTNTHDAKSARINESGLSERETAGLFNITGATAAKWLRRDNVQNRTYRDNTLHTNDTGGALETVDLSLRH